MGNFRFSSARNRESRTVFWGGWYGFLISSKLPILPFGHQFICDYLNQLKPFDRLNNLKQFEPVWFYRNVNIFSLFRRLAENSKLQSNVKYHAEFEAAKGKFTQIADDPETQRIKANSQVIRLVF